MTQWSGEKGKNAVSLSNGYTFKPGSPVTLSVEEEEFDLFVREETAWTKDQAEDDALIKDLRAGHSMIVKGVSSRGTETADTYNLDGITGAYKAITKECKTEKAKKKTKEEGE